MIMSKAWERLERLMRWEYKKRYGRMPSEGAKEDYERAILLRDDEEGYEGPGGFEHPGPAKPQFVWMS
jgi:hypothetical protein